MEDDNQEIEYLNYTNKHDDKPEVEIPYLIPVNEKSQTEFPFLNPVFKTNNQESYVPEIKQETFTPPPPVPSPINEVIVTSRKRSSRLMSRESTSRVHYDGADLSDTDSDYTSTSYQSSSKKTCYSSKTTQGKYLVKSEVDEDESSIAGSALEMKYSELRQRNNEASRKSRQNRKSKENVMETQAEQLDKENRRLKADVEKLEHILKVLRKTILDGVNRAKQK